MTAAAAMWLGPSPAEAVAAFHRARVSGMTTLRSLVVGQIASHRDCWAFRARLARAVGCSVRTVQRAITDATSRGLIGVARAKQTEKPPGVDRIVPCGWSHRWTVGWGLAGRALGQAIDKARARWMVRHQTTRAVAPCVARGNKPGNKCGHTPRRWTAAELDAELARAAERARPPDEPDDA